MKNVKRFVCEKTFWNKKNLFSIHKNINNVLCLITCKHVTYPNALRFGCINDIKSFEKETGLETCLDYKLVE